jgi:hypothetical protein
MNSVCKVLRRGTGDSVFDPETGDTLAPVDQVIYNGPCRVIEKQQEAQRIVAGEQGASRETYLVSIDIEHPSLTDEIRAGESEDWVVFTSNPNDPQLLNFRMSVEHVQVGSQAWEKDLTCWVDTTRQAGD